MFTLQKSALFMRQWQGYAQGYKDRAGLAVAERFIAAVEDALRFISESPLSCPLYDTGAHDDLRRYAFRKWNLRGFPHAVFFHLEQSSIFVEVLYAQRMDIPTRLGNDLGALH